MPLFCEQLPWWQAVARRAAREKAEEAAWEEWLVRLYLSEEWFEYLASRDRPVLRVLKEDE